MTLKISFRRPVDIGGQLLRQGIHTATLAQVMRWQDSVQAIERLYDNCVINAEQARRMREQLVGLIEKGVKEK